MILPINGHILIEPVPHEDFVPTEHGTFQEIGIVIDFDPNVNPPEAMWDGTGVVKTEPIIRKGCRVYFDSWLAAKYPTKIRGEFYWLVNISDVRAVEYEEISPKLTV